MKFMTRRFFIKASTAITSMSMLNTLETWAQPLSVARSSPGFSLLIFGTNWGFGGSTEEFCSLLKKEGYDGAEFWYPENNEERKEILSAYAKYQLRYGFLVGGHDKDPEKHFQQFKSQLEGAVRHNPVYINCHSGRDHFKEIQNKKFIDLTTELSIKSGIPIYHETHRSRILYSAPVARTYMETNSALQITFDVSHWCNVHESLLDDQEDTIAMALSRAGHIHARIGHPEGPQVNDPRAPEWKNAVDAHFNWWDKIIERKKKEGKLMTILTEFGPADYMPTIPYTRQPVSNQWEVNVHMLKVLRARYS
jgi:sugar phosphate isomerase/epimerase